MAMKDLTDQSSDQRLRPHFYDWRGVVRATPVLPVGKWIRASSATHRPGVGGLGFAPIDLGRLAAGGRQQSDGPLPAQNLVLLLP